MNENGGINGHTVNFQIEDNESDEARASRLSSRFVEDEKDFIISAYRSPMMRAAAPAADQAGIPIMNSSGVNYEMHGSFDFAEALHASDRLGLERFATMQNHYNLAYREEERETLPLCEREGVGAIPWSPLARGFLARPHEAFLETRRAKYMADSAFSDRIDTYRANDGIEINERVEELAAEKGVTMAQLALAWLLHQDAVDAPIVGTTSVEHLENAVEALDVRLSDSDLDYLEEPYGPVPVNGHE